MLSEIGRSPPFQPMRALRLQWPWAFNPMCEVALRTAFGHSLLGSHVFMVTAFGTCVEWPLFQHSHQLRASFWCRTTLNTMLSVSCSNLCYLLDETSYEEVTNIVMDDG